MPEFECDLTKISNEDLVFDLNSDKVIQVSNRLLKVIGENFFQKNRTLSDFDAATPGFSNGLFDSRREAFGMSSDHRFEYELLWEERAVPITEFSWYNSSTNTIHSFLYVDKTQKIFELSRDSLVEVADKLTNPAILFDASLARVLYSNRHLTSLLTAPLSTLGEGFYLPDFFKDHSDFEEVARWVCSENEAALTFTAELFLKHDGGSWFELDLSKLMIDGEHCVMAILKNVDSIRSTKKELLNSNQILTRVVDVQNKFLSQKAGYYPYQLFLDTILEVSKAEYGFIGKIEIDSMSERILKIHAATDFSQQSEAAGTLYRNYINDGFIFRSFNNLFGACIIEAKVICENNPVKNPHSKNIHIPGHPVVESFLGIPIIKGEEVIGLIGLANKPGGFLQSDIDDLQPFATTYSVILEALRSEREKQRFEKDSQEKAFILSKVGDHLPDLIIVVKEDDELEFISPSSSVFPGSFRPDEIRKKIKTLIRKTVRPSERVAPNHYRSRLMLHDKNKAEFWLESTINVLGRSEHGKMIMVIRDVTLQMKYEQGLKESLKKEREFSTFISDFMGIVSHEFKTPIATISSSLEITNYYLKELEDEPASSRIKKHLDKMRVEVDFLHSLVVHSLDYDRFVKGSMILRKKGILLKSFMEKIFQNNGFFSTIALLIEVDPGFTVEWDPFLMERAIVNLVSNARKYGGSGRRPQIRVFGNDSEYGLEVRDFGIGIPQSDLPHIFTPFYRAGNSSAYEGSGLGLVAVKNFVEMHGGEVSVKSELGRGTEIAIRFPITASSLAD